MILVAGYLTVCHYTVCPGFQDTFVARPADAVDIDRVNVSEASGGR